MIAGYNREYERERSLIHSRAVERERSPTWQVIAGELLKGPAPTMPELKRWRNLMLQPRDKERCDGKAKHRKYL